MKRRNGWTVWWILLDSGPWACRGPLNSLSLCCSSLRYTSHTPPRPPLFSPPPPGGLSAGQPNSQLSGAAVGPPPAAAPVGGHLPGSHLAELWAGPLVWSSGQCPREALHPAVRSHPWGERSTESTLKKKKSLNNYINKKRNKYFEYLLWLSSWLC